MAFQKLAEKSAKRSRLSGTDGQTVVEYILIMIVTVSFLVGLGTQIFQPFRDFLKSYMGDYVACLLETGELPSLGDQDAVSALQDQGCNAHFEKVSLKRGRPPIGVSGTASSFSGSNSGASSSASASSSSKGSDSNGTAGGGSGKVTNAGALRAHGKGNAMESSSGSAKVSEVALNPEQSKFFGRRGAWGSQSATGPGGKATALGSAVLSEEEKRKQERKENSNRTIASGDEVSGPVKKVTIKKPEPKVIAEKDEPFTFGNYLKFLLITAIIIALIVILGSQALKISKSRE